MASVSKYISGCTYKKSSQRSVYVPPAGRKTFNIWFRENDALVLATTQQLQVRNTLTSATVTFIWTTNLPNIFGVVNLHLLSAQLWERKQLLVSQCWPSFDGYEEVFGVNKCQSSLLSLSFLHGKYFLTEVDVFWSIISPTVDVHYCMYIKNTVPCVFWMCSFPLYIETVYFMCTFTCSQIKLL